MPHNVMGDDLPRLFLNSVSVIEEAAGGWPLPQSRDGTDGAVRGKGERRIEKRRRTNPRDSHPISLRDNGLVIRRYVMRDDEQTQFSRLLAELHLSRISGVRVAGGDRMSGWKA